MNTFIKILICLLFTSPIFSQGIEFFEGTWQEALEKAKTEDKLLFVDSYTTWCGPCIRMAKTVFTQQKVGDFFNKNFINLKLDMEKTDGVSFGHKYPVSAYPTLHFLDGDGKVVKKVKGGQQVESLIAIGQDAIKANDKSGDYAELYEAGNREYDLVYKYVKALNTAGKPSLKISNDYLNSNPKITEEQKLNFLFVAVVDSDSKLYDQMMAEKQKISGFVGEESFVEKCKSACLKTIEKAIDYEQEDLLNQTISKAKKAFPKDAEEFALRSKMKFYSAIDNKSEYTSAYKDLAKKSSKDPEVLKDIVKDIMAKYPKESTMLAHACDYAESLFNINKDTDALSLYCSALLSKGDVQKAIDVATKAKEDAQKDGGEVSFYEGLILYLQSKKA